VFLFNIKQEVKLCEGIIFKHVRKISERDCRLRHVFPSGLMKQLGSHRTDFDKISYLKLFLKSCPENPNLTKTREE
jgi:hypothetical protein